MRWLNRHALVTLPAQFDQANAERVRELLQSVLTRDLLVLIVDMSDTAECDHACGEVLACVYQRAMMTGTDLRLVVTSSSLRRVLAIAGLDGIVPVYSSVAAALAATVPADVPPPARTAGRKEYERRDAEAGRAGPPGHDLGVEIALLDRNGAIVWVNHAWREFAAANGGDPDRTGIGVSYVDICAAAPDDPGCAQVGAAIWRALAGDLPGALTVEIPCHSPDTARWFDVLISSRQDDDGQAVGATVTLSLARSQNLGSAGSDPRNRG